MPEALNEQWEERYNRPLLSDSLLLNHPVLMNKQLSLKSYELDQRLKREKLKPKLKLKYNPLIQTNDDNFLPAVFALDNYKFGLDFSMPLFLRTERADVRLGQLKIQSASYELVDKRNVLLNKLEIVDGKIQLLNQQLILQKENTLNYLRMLEAEQTRFSFGESSVFLLNKRQEKYLEVQIKEVELVAKRQLSILDYLFVSGEIQEVLFPQ